MEKKIFKIIQKFTKKGNYLYIGIMIILLFFLLNEIELDYKIVLKEETFLDFLKLMASILGIFVSVLVGFYFVLFQLIDTRRHTYFSKLREHIEKLKNIQRNLPDELIFIYESLGETINYLDDIKIRDGVPAKGEAWLLIEEPYNILLDNGIEPSGFIHKENEFIDDLFSNYLKIEELLNELVILSISTLSLRGTFQNIIKLLFNVLYYIVVFIITSAFIDSNIEINASLMLLLTLISSYVSSVFVLQIMNNLFIFYRNYMSDFFERYN
ncbi:hypothetical protein QUF65_14185 [Lysinibacillus sphaericus]|uniref:hypothetical protein n=1 Tax=Lysinibacillus sphaericus TaxID=1421 RepID=UPI0025A157AA|nr:hypothetical protein [Lysinibacillus sphaericus]MDM5352032.1 hypothetical protein [Lysinibacillus sphaericus]